jgi:DNA repair protein RadC
LVLGGGCVQEKSVRLARELLAGMGGLFGLPGASVAMLRHGGLRDAQASALLASREIASRLALQSIPKQRFLDPPGSVARYLLLRYQQRDQEVMGAVFLNVRASSATQRSSAAPSIAPRSSRAKSSRSACCAAPPAS